MMRKVLIGLAAVALATGVSTLNASAHHGGSGGGPAMSMHGGGGGPQVSKGGQLRLTGPRHFKEPGAYGFHRERFGYRERYHHRPYYRYGYRPHYYGGGYGGSCWTRVWTPEGYRSQWVCGYGHPYYGYRYGHRPFYGPRYGHYRPFHGPRYGRY